MDLSQLLNKLQEETLSKYFSKTIPTYQSSRLIDKLKSGTSLPAILEEQANLMELNEFCILDEALQSNNFKQILQENNNRWNLIHSQHFQSLWTIFLPAKKNLYLLTFLIELVSNEFCEDQLKQYYSNIDLSQQKVCEDILKSEQFTDWLKISKQQKKKHQKYTEIIQQMKSKIKQKLQQLLNFKKTDMKNLIQLIMNQQSEEDELLKLKETMIISEYKKLIQVIKSQELISLKVKVHQIYEYQKILQESRIRLMQNFKNLNLNQSQLINYILQGLQQKDILDQLQEVLSARQHKKIINLINSLTISTIKQTLKLKIKQLGQELEKIIIKQNENAKTIKAQIQQRSKEEEQRKWLLQIFKPFKIDNSILINYIMQGKQFNTILDSYEDKLTAREYNQLINVINSQKMVNFIKSKEKITQTNWIDQFLGQKRLELIQIFKKLNFNGIQELIKLTLKGQSTDQYLVQLNQRLSQKQFRHLKYLLNSKQMIKIRKQIEQYNSFSRMNNRQELLQQLISDPQKMAQYLLKQNGDKQIKFEQPQIEYNISCSNETLDYLKINQSPNTFKEGTMQYLRHQMNKRLFLKQIFKIFNNDISNLIKSIIVRNKDINTALNQLSTKMNAKDFSILKGIMIIFSSQNQQNLHLSSKSTPSQNQIDRFFQHFSVKSANLKISILDYDIEKQKKSLNQLSKSMLLTDFISLQKNLYSSQFLKFRCENLNHFQFMVPASQLNTKFYLKCSMILQLITNNFKQYLLQGFNIYQLAIKLIKGEKISSILQDLGDILPYEQFKSLQRILNSKELFLILYDLTQEKDQDKIEVDYLFRDLKECQRLKYIILQGMPNDQFSNQVNMLRKNKAASFVRILNHIIQQKQLNDLRIKLIKKAKLITIFNKYDKNVIDSLVKINTENFQQILSELQQIIGLQQYQIKSRVIYATEVQQIIGFKLIQNEKVRQVLTYFHSKYIFVSNIQLINDILNKNTINQSLENHKFTLTPLTFQTLKVQIKSKQFLNFIYSTRYQDFNHILNQIKVLFGFLQFNQQFAQSIVYKDQFIESLEEILNQQNLVSLEKLYPTLKDEKFKSILEKIDKKVPEYEQKYIIQKKKKKFLYKKGTKILDIKFDKNFNFQNDQIFVDKLYQILNDQYQLKEHIQCVLGKQYEKHLQQQQLLKLERAQNLQLMPLLFFKVFHVSQHQDNNKAKMLFKKIIQISKDQDLLYRILLQQNQRNRASKKILQSQRLQILFFCNFGCAVILTQKQNFYPIQISLIFPTQWNFISYVYAGNIQYLSGQGKSSTSIEVGEIISDQQLIKLVSQLNEQIEAVLRQQMQLKYKQVDQTPSYLLQIVKQAIKNINSSSSARKTNIYKQVKRLLSKGGTLDVGAHTGTREPNTSLSVSIACLQYVFKDAKLIQYLIFSYKLRLLKKIVEEVKIFQLKKFKEFENCVCQLTSSLKKIKSQHIQFDQGYFSKQIACINQTLQRIYKPQLNHKIKISQLTLDIIKTERKKELYFQTIRNHDINKNFLSKKFGDLGFSKPFIITSFNNLFQQKYVFQEGYWIMLVERYFFNLAIERLGPENINIEVNIKQIQCSERSRISKMHQVIFEYSKIIKESEKGRDYGMKLRNQSYSHYFLIRQIASAIAFEVIKRQRKNLTPNLQDYRCPLSIQHLYPIFYSLSYQARKAIDAMNQYSKRNANKNAFFVLEKSNESYYQFVNQLASSLQTIKVWKHKVTKQLEKQIQSLEKKIQQFRKRYEDHKAQKKYQQQKSCSCHQQSKKIKYSWQFTKCRRCKALQDSTKSVDACQRQELPFIIAKFSQRQLNLYAFLQNIPLCILGMIKILFENQISFIVKDQSIPRNFFTTSYGELIIFANEIKNAKFNLASSLHRTRKSLVLYPQPMPIFYYKKQSSGNKIQEELVSPQKYQLGSFQNSHLYMLNTPSQADTARQHQIYSKISLKKKGQSISDYINFGSIRVAVHTELIVLSHKLKNRQIELKFLIQTAKLQNLYEKELYLKMLIVLNTCAHIQSFRFYNKGNPILYSFIKESLLDLIKNYTVKQKYQDMYFLHITGIFFSLLSKQLNEQKSVLKIAINAFDKYLAYAQQNSNGDNTVKSQLAYFLHGIFSFFNQKITVNLDKESVFLWIKLQLMYRINKIFSDQNLKDQRYRCTMNFFDHYRRRAIFNNVQGVSQYFQNNLNQLTEIIKLIDSDCSPQVKWTYTNQKGQYIFTGIFNQKIYEINLFTGVLLKNGSQLAGLPDIIKKDQTYIKIFGKNRDLQVYTQKDGSLRTRSDFSVFFPNEPNTMILFQFKISDNGLIIRKIIKRQSKEIKYVLIPENVLIESNANIPQLYLKLCFAWYSEDENILVFRNKQIQTMKRINLIILLKKTEEKKVKVVQARIIENNLKQQSILYLKEQSSTNLFNLLILSSNKHSKISQILSSIQHPEYILQISSPNKSLNNSNRLTKFWLHRYNLKFTFCIQKGLLSDNFQGYAIAQEYDSHQYLPWKYEDKVNCLILKKVDDNIRFAKNHNFVVLIPNTLISISESAKNVIPLGLTQKMTIFSYQIHDHFHDLRSKKMLQHLHLAGIIASCYSPSFMISNIEYAIHLLRSCYGIKPLSKQQQSKLENILKNSINLNQYQLVLICYVIFRSSKLVKDILPYEKQKNGLQKFCFFQSSSQLIQNCKFALRQMFNSQQLSVRLQLSQVQLNILRLSSYEELHINYKEKSRWNNQNKASIAIPENYTDKLRQWETNLNDSYSVKNQILQSNQQKMQDIQPMNTVINLNLEGNCQMSIDQKKEIQSSLQSYSNIKKKLNRLNIHRENKEYYQNKFKNNQINLKKSSQQILQMLDGMQKNNKQNLSFISKKRSTIKQIDFTNILCNQSYFFLFYPQVTQQNALIFKKIIKLWMEINIEFNSILRIQQILRDQQVDKINLLREIQSPRAQISKNVAWIAFEMQLKTQIWLSQYQTFKLLDSNKSGIVTQLNMGQGKTQVIIPMIVLNEIYNKKINTPRVNILTPLFPQAQENYFKFLSITGFKLHLLPICFNRQVNVNSINIKKLQHAIDLFKENSLVLIDRDSVLSMVLKLREQHGVKKNKIHQQFQLNQSCHKKDRWIFRNKRILDIFDEVDALMTAKKSFVYAVGNASPLPNSRIRYEYSCLFIQIIIKQLLKYLLDQQIAVIQQSYDHARQRVLQGKYPKGFRFLTKIPTQKLMQFRQKLVIIFLNQFLPPQLQFYKELSKDQQLSLMKYCIDEKSNPSCIPQSLTNLVYQHIFMVRGLIAYGLLQHCLTLRNGVDYGTPNKDNLKRVGVPYQAADMPSKKSQYSHPQVAIILSYLSYYNRGLSQEQFYQALKYLLKQKSSSKQKSSFQKKLYQQWIKCIQKQSMRPISIKIIQQINQQSVVQKEQLYKAFRFCRATIAFWLVHCVFPIDLMQYTKSITSSSWDIADSKNSVGFSGTKDTHWLFPQYLYLKQSIIDQINGTDGKMIELMLQNTIDVLCIKQNNEDLWKRFCQNALQLKTGCIIDVGAILAGKSLQLEIVPWISNHPLFKKLNFKGILYCNQGIWKVYDTTTHSIIARYTSIQQHETFVIFDEARSRGADVKMKTQTIAALSLGPYMAKDKLMQAVGRLRTFGRNQKIYILSTEDIFKKIEGFNTMLQSSEKAKIIVEWVCKNSINDNKKMLYPNSKLAWIHFDNAKSSQEVVIQQFDPSLKKMYESQIKFDTIQNLNQQMAKDHIQRCGDCQLVIQLQQNINKYGNNYTVQCQSLQDICERQIEMIEQTHKQVHIETVELEAIKEQTGITICNNPISSLDIKLDDRLKFSKNFLMCTKSKLKLSCKPTDEDNQLCQINFVLIRPNKKLMVVLTQKQASSLIQKQTQCLGPSSLDKIIESQFLVRFEDLSINSLCIAKHGLEKALTDAQFFNGKQKFQKIELIDETIRINKNRLKKTHIQRIICHFLQRRRMLEDKYMCSHLESVYKRIISSK